jgi:hypothetical protein
MQGRRYLRIRVFNRTEAAGLKGRVISFGDSCRRGRRARYIAMTRAAVARLNIERS